MNAAELPRIVPAVRAVIRDAQGRVLLIRRRDNRRWALPAGAIEPFETVQEALEREVQEETGLVVLSAVPFAVYSGRSHRITDSRGEEVQLLTIAFRVDRFGGELMTETDETVNARFVGPDELAGLADHHAMSLRDLDRFDGSLILG